MDAELRKLERGARARGEDAATSARLLTRQARLGELDLPALRRGVGWAQDPAATQALVTLGEAAPTQLSPLAMCQLLSAQDRLAKSAVYWLYHHRGDPPAAYEGLSAVLEFGACPCAPCAARIDPLCEQVHEALEAIPEFQRGHDFTAFLRATGELLREVPEVWAGAEQLGESTRWLASSFARSRWPRLEAEAGEVSPESEARPELVTCLACAPPPTWLPFMKPKAPSLLEWIQQVVQLAGRRGPLAVARRLLEDWAANEEDPYLVQRVQTLGAWRCLGALEFAEATGVHAPEEAEQIMARIREAVMRRAWSHDPLALTALDGALARGGDSTRSLISRFDPWAGALLAGALHLGRRGLEVLLRDELLPWALGTHDPLLERVAGQRAASRSLALRQAAPSTC